MVNFPLINEQYPTINGIRFFQSMASPMAAWQGAGGARWDAVQRVCALGLWAKGWAKRCLKATKHHEPWRKNRKTTEKERQQLFFIMCCLTYIYICMTILLLVLVFLCIYTYMWYILYIYILYRERERDRYRMPTVSPMCHESGTEPWQSNI